ncbi:toprim domain-containing protein [Candidatus Bathyarchaeota archaeon]|nr:MAG: toprim domain-containing protein [Candidatus Bathyarchaeota archaeon]HDD69955.1 toprim domain-containing protein [Candidatus Bathyarchaeota archaeon]
MPRNSKESANNKVKPLSTHLKEKREKILKILENLKEESEKGTPIIVEGKKDIQALRTFDIKGKIISAKTGGKSFLDVIYEVENTKKREVILLLDFDRRGKELTKNLKKYLETTGIKLNLTFWKKLSSLVGTEVKDVEGLATYMETLKSKINNS